MAHSRCLRYYLTNLTFLWIGSAMALYALFALWWQHTLPVGDYAAAFEIPADFTHLLTMSPASAVVKVMEILCQQLCALMVINGLHLYEWSLPFITIVFVSVVWAVHLPGISFFGVWLGRFFLWSSTLLAFVYPVIIVSIPQGFGLILLAHTIVYVLWFRFIMMKMRRLRHGKSPA